MGKDVHEELSENSTQAMAHPDKHVEIVNMCHGKHHSIMMAFCSANGQHAKIDSTIIQTLSIPEIRLATGIEFFVMMSPFIRTMILEIINTPAWSKVFCTTNEFLILLWFK